MTWFLSLCLATLVFEWYYALRVIKELRLRQDRQEKSIQEVYNHLAKTLDALEELAARSKDISNFLWERDANARIPSVGPAEVERTTKISDFECLQ